MNRWFQSALIVFAVFQIAPKLFAQCDPEFEQFMNAKVAHMSATGESQSGISNYVNGMRAERLEKLKLTVTNVEGMRQAIANIEREIPKWAANANRNSGVTRLDYLSGLRGYEYDLCLNLYLLSKNQNSNQSNDSSRSINPNANIQRQQPTQQNQSIQQPSQQAQQQAQQAQEAARVAQTRADQARQGKRKTHDPAAEAHQCIEIDKDPGLFGAFKNTCGYKVNFSTCNYRPRVRQGGFNWSADFDCEQQKFGLHTPGGGVAVASHNRNTEMVYWFACKAPAFPVDTEFVAGSGVRGRCN